jgi:uncharacterized repeat protein (TIGR01451 family)
LPRLTNINTLDFTNCSVQCLSNYGTVGWSNPPLSSLPLCDLFNPSGCSVYWNISGKAFFDANNDCLQNNNENALQNIRLNLSSNSVLQQITYSGGEGLYSFDVSTFGNYSVELDTTNIPFNIICPAGGSYFDTLSVTDSTVYSDDFALKCKNGFDVGAWAIVPESFRPNHRTKIRFSAGDWANFFGVSCATGVSGTITVLLNGPVHYYGTLPGFITPSVTTANSVTYNISNFGLISSTTDFAFEVETDTTAIAGSSVCIDINVTPVNGDYNQANNTLTNCFTVQASLDPNNKLVYPEGIIDTTVDWLTYTIRFQNTGTSFADNIYILDTLDTNLDVSTFQLLATSHNSIVQVLPGNIVRFNFPNINLPDSTNDEEHSHGYVQYKIRIKKNLPIGTHIANTAYIYFDFNQPVVTNTTHNTIDLANEIPIIFNHTPVNAYPQPFADELTIDLSAVPESISIIDLYGREIFSQTATGRININTSGWNSGVYILKTKSGRTLSLVKL